ncbi:hypothetical protein BKA00_003930 [Actinomadura coerulea]|uniref:Uncharacterized protein n=1 Tax=Actinomadura coerulea TaxID=46159 RepID=A0A7X0G248_9ACTN|nr:hypothetical protein [Actinomadura coerulea]MBB6397016.1 hypothetical protein [Actinomadura coerulea]GGP96042.1 hypothetical protein GCM10010187_09590 [Actinomadura coerulea]
MKDVVFGIAYVQRFDDPSNPTVYGVMIDPDGNRRVCNGDNHDSNGDNHNGTGHNPAAGDNQR